MTRDINFKIDRLNDRIEVWDSHDETDEQGGLLYFTENFVNALDETDPDAEWPRSNWVWDDADTVYRIDNCLPADDIVQCAFNLAITRTGV